MLLAFVGIYYLAERALTSDWSVNIFIMVVNKNSFKLCFGQKIILIELSKIILKESALWNFYS